MKQDETNTNQAEELDTTSETTSIDEDNSQVAQSKPSALDDIIAHMNLSSGVAATAKAILEPMENGETPSKSVVELIVKALNHDEDVKNADAAGYLRGRNEIIEAATKTSENQEPQPVTFPVYRKRSFWDR